MFCCYKVVVMGKLSLCKYVKSEKCIEDGNRAFFFSNSNLNFLAKKSYRSVNNSELSEFYFSLFIIKLFCTFLRKVILTNPFENVGSKKPSYPPALDRTRKSFSYEKKELQKTCFKYFGSKFSSFGEERKGD